MRKFLFAASLCFCFLCSTSLVSGQKRETIHSFEVASSPSGYAYNIHLNYPQEKGSDPFYVIYSADITKDPIESFRAGLKKQLEKDELEYKKYHIRRNGSLEKEYRILNVWNHAVIDDLSAGAIDVLLNGRSLSGGGGIGKVPNKPLWFATKAINVGSFKKIFVVWSFKIDTQKGKATNMTLTLENNFYKELEKIYDSMVK